MSSTKHTDEFNSIFNSKGIAQPTFTIANTFVSRLSKEVSDEVCEAILAKTKNKYVTNKEIYIYCKSNNIEADYDPYNSYVQSKLNFKKKIDYSSFKQMDDIKIDNRTGFVLSNDIENKKIIIEFDDNDETKTISYE